MRARAPAVDAPPLQAPRRYCDGSIAWRGSSKRTQFHHQADLHAPAEHADTMQWSGRAGAGRARTQEAAP